MKRDSMLVHRICMTRPTETVVVSNDGGGKNTAESETLDERTNDNGEREVLVVTSYDGGGKNTDWVKPV